MNNCRPVQLLFVDEQTNELRINPEGLEVIELFTPPFHVLSVTGTARRGKTTLLNILLDRPKIPFQTSSKTDACTVGVWIWSSQVQLGDKKVILMDTEGTEKQQLF